MNQLTLFEMEPVTRKRKPRKSHYAMLMDEARDYVAKDKPIVDSPDEVADLLRPLVLNLKQEVFFALLLNTRNQVIEIVEVSKGTVDKTMVHPRDVFSSAILANAAKILVAHNHPSGDPAPSEQDLQVTEGLIMAGKILQIEVIDHIIVGHKTDSRKIDTVSLRRLGFIAQLAELVLNLPTKKE